MVLAIGEITRIPRLFFIFEPLDTMYVIEYARTYVIRNTRRT